MNAVRKLIWGAVVPAALASCSLEPKKAPTLELRIDTNEVSRDSVSSQASIRVAPETVDQFVCLGVNVTGPGIADSSNHDPETDLAGIFNRLVAGERCSYRGVIAGPFYPNSQTSSFGPIDVSLNIPAGPGRMIQVFGVTDPVACATTFQDDSDTDDKRFYELGRAFLPNLFSSQSVTLSTQWNSLSSSEQEARTMDCGGAACSTASLYESHDTELTLSSGGPYYKFAIRFTVPDGGAYLKSLTIQAATVTSTANLPVHIYADASGSPGTSITSGSLNNINTGGGQITAEFGTGHGVFLAASGPTDFWLVLEGVSIGVKMRYHATTPDGSKYMLFNGSTWNSFTSGIPWHAAVTCIDN